LGRRLQACARPALSLSGAGALLAACASAPPQVPQDDRCTRAAANSGGQVVLVSSAPTVVEPEPVAEPTPPPLPPIPDTLPEFSKEELERIRHAQRYVHTAAKKHGVDVNLINGVIWVESRFQPRARGKLGPRGMMQLMPRTGRALARELNRKYLPHSIDFNLDAGTLYLAHMLAMFDGDVTLALCAYNAGPAPVKAAQQGGPPVPENIQRYAQRVLVAARVFGERGY
jgi:soluble lytic murein transglycosylase-like protein